MRVVIKPEFQIQRINQLMNRLETLKDENFQVLAKRPNSKSWAPIEVVRHMILGQEAYQRKIMDGLEDAVSGPGLSELRTRAIPSYLIKRFPPKEGRIRFKMKTMKRFTPVLSLESLDKNGTDEILREMEKSLKELKEWVNVYRTNTLKLNKFNSAIGAMVRFNVPEACEFILCHNERHFQQIENALK